MIYQYFLNMRFSTAKCNKLHKLLLIVCCFRIQNESKTTIVRAVRAMQVRVYF